MAKKKAPPKEQAFLDDILAQREDDTVRRIYADWLVDNGQPHRGEFIRVQCDLASLPEDDPRRAALLEREWELLAVYRDEWLQTFPGWACKGRPTFGRGFVERVNITATEFLKKGTGLFAAFPIRELRLRAARQRMGEVAASPLLARVAGLDLERNALATDDLQALVASPHTGGLSSLSLSGNGQGRALGETLPDWSQFPRLTHLDLSNNWLAAETIHRLAKTPNPAWRWLDLGKGPLEADSLRALVAGQRLATLKHLLLGAAQSGNRSWIEGLVQPDNLLGLTSLDLGRSYLDRDDLAPLGKSPLLERLETLRLESTALNSDHLHALFDHGRPTRLRHFDLSFNSRLATYDAMTTLAAAPLDALQTLNLHATGVDPDGLRILARSPHLNGLRSLTLSGGQFGDEGVRALVASSWTNLTHLRLSQTAIGPAGAAALAAWPGLSRLRVLALDGNPLGEGIASLAASPYLGNLYHLSLGTTNMGNEGVRALARAANLGSLRHLNLWSCWADESALRELASSPRLPRLLVLKVQVVMIDSADELRKFGREPVV
jgi:uncharacterized protein (TIGR02996 family)